MKSQPHQNVERISGASAAGFQSAAAAVPPRVQVCGKFLRLGEQRWYVKGLTYGPFAPNAAGDFLPRRMRRLRDLAKICNLGANAVRVYHVPSVEFLDEAQERGLRVMVDVPWEKHRCFFEDFSSQQEARRLVRETARRLGSHPALLAISVGNEIPHDVVRFYGARRVACFIEELVATAKEQAAECLVTYTSYPSTEFLTPRGIDFYCANVYLNDSELLARYLERLQHVAGHLPLVLGECGFDSIRHGSAGQAACISSHLRQVFRRGLAGSFVFSYTDDWYTGGSQVSDWAFGVTDSQRREKPAAGALRNAWAGWRCSGEGSLPRVSVVVCSYNGAATLQECLSSLSALEYPDYEVILVDDGSTDQTPQIAACFPQVRYIRQPNLGLSAARNTGLHAASGQVVAYTDSDCVADESWLLYLIQAMQDQQVHAIGGPNVPPPSDNWRAKCVAASPGGPSHVMLDDQRAEHIPGCNMAFDRQVLLEIGGFDPQFRQAGDDVDICWRLLAADKSIGYAASALVWHHRRSTVRAYLRQQKGYGRSEAMLHFKHPQRFNALGCSVWHGVIYGEGAVGLPVISPIVYHGRFGSGPFQIIYRHNRYSLWAYFTVLEWHALAGLMLLLSIASLPLAAVSGVMWCLSLTAALRMAVAAPLPDNSPAWCRPLVFALHLAQPVVRSSNRYLYRLSRKRLPKSRVSGEGSTAASKRISWRAHDLYWSSDSGRGREHLLERLVDQARTEGWLGDLHAEWKAHDVEIWADRWQNVQIHTATEELGGPRRFTRVRCVLHLTRFARTAMIVTLLLLLASLVQHRLWSVLPVAALAAYGFAAVVISRRRCRRAVSSLIWSAGQAAGLDPVADWAASPADQPSAGPLPAPNRTVTAARDHAPLPQDPRGTGVAADAEDETAVPAY